MRALSWVLLSKIILTASLWSIPLLFFPASLLQWLGFPIPEPQLFLRLLGMAYLALLVGYVLGWRETRQNRYPEMVVWVGLVSNGGACVILVVAATLGLWSTWGAFAQGVMWTSLVGTGGIAMGLAVFGVGRK